MSKQGLGHLANIGPITYYFEMFQYVQCVGMLIINFSQIACVIKKLSIKELLLEKHVASHWHQKVKSLLGKKFITDYHFLAVQFSHLKL